MYEKIVFVTRPSRLEELVARFNTKAQAKFYIEHSGGEFEEYVSEDAAYHRSLDTLRKLLDVGLKTQIIDRSFLPTFLFSETDLVVVVGQDGLVANTAKYAGEQPILGFNPDPARYDGILVTLGVARGRQYLEQVIAGTARIHEVTLAEAMTKDGQRLLAFNDLFIGATSHISARYRLEYQDRSEHQSSSGIIVSTGAGSTGWLSSVFNMVSSVNQFLGSPPTSGMKLSWQDPRLLFIVREPFISKHSSAALTVGMIKPGQTLVIESRMPAGGTIFSDGIESDRIEFNAGSIAFVGPSKQRTRLVLPDAQERVSRPRSGRLAGPCDSVATIPGANLRQDDCRRRI